MFCERGGAVGFVSRLGGGVLEAFESIFDVFWHRDMHLLVWVIPLNGESTVSFALFFDQALIVFLNCFQEVFGVFFTDVFYSKIVDDQGENDGATLVFRPGVVSLCE
jgi:hypothetical protein